MHILVLITFLLRRIFPSMLNWAKIYEFSNSKLSMSEVLSFLFYVGLLLLSAGVFGTCYV